ncbi:MULTISPECIES: NAD(P)(+) transhydrogenase (Re/Si-specific) subunit beta [Alphaproteobacteria]|nr:MULTISPECIES: NAD(P)(+) transhydrogenase (Re/Si-specific) subunit beta [Alphaproteobacteria]
MLLAIAAARGARGYPLSTAVPLLASGLSFAAVAAMLAAEPSFGGFLLVVLALGVGATFGAVAALGLPVAHIPLFLTGSLVLYGLVALLLSFAVVDSGGLLLSAGPVSGDLERAGSAVLAGIAGALVLAGGSVLFLRRLLPAREGRRAWPRPALSLQIALAGGVLLLAVVFLVTVSPLAYWAVVVAAVLAGGIVVQAMDARANWPLSILLTGLCGMATAAIGFALANLVLIMVGGLVGASMAAVFSGLCREAGRGPVGLLFGRRD